MTARRSDQSASSSQIVELLPHYSVDVVNLKSSLRCEACGGPLREGDLMRLTIYPNSDRHNHVEHSPGCEDHARS